MRFVTDDAKVHQEVMRQVLELVHHTDVRQTPPAIAQKIHRVIRQVTGNPDPYRQRKQESNMLALELCPQLKDRIRASDNPLETAVRLAIAGNVIDFGIYSSLDGADIVEVINRALMDGWDAGCLEELAEAVNNAREILYIGDNAGEIVLDRLLIEELAYEKVTFVVKGSPILNDVTLEDAVVTRMTDLVEVVDNGSDAPGTILEDCSADFRDRFHRSDLIIAKGQGNYESLGGIDKNVFFVLKAKCPVIARDLDCEVGEMILRRSNGSGETSTSSDKENTHAEL